MPGKSLFFALAMATHRKNGPSVSEGPVSQTSSDVYARVLTRACAGAAQRGPLQRGQRP